MNAASDRVDRSDLRRIVMAEHARSVWQCNALHSEAVRKDCLSLRHAPSRGALWRATAS